MLCACKCVHTLFVDKLVLPGGTLRVRVCFTLATWTNFSYPLGRVRTPSSTVREREREIKREVERERVFIFKKE